MKWGSGVRLHGSNPEPLMSALGQEQTLRGVRPMSALPPKADVSRRVCEGVAQRRGPNSVTVPSGASPLPRDYESTLGCAGAFMMRSISGPPVFIKRQMSSAAKTRKATLSKVV